MKKIIKTLSLTLASIFILLLSGCSSRLTGNQQTDEGYKAFTSITKAYKEKIGFHKELSHWGLELPSGEKFEWSKDMSANKADFAMVMLADPLIKTGLDVKKLDENEWLFNPAGKENGKEIPNLLIKPYNVGDKKQNSNGSDDAMRRLIRSNTKLLAYHEQMQHYRLSLGEGYEVQWTEKLGLNDADMSFVLKAEPLIKAGLDISKLEGSGWLFKPASKDDMGNNPDQLIKIFKLK